MRDSTASETNRKRVIAEAMRYVLLGLKIIPVPFGQKAPVMKEWQRLDIGAEDVETYFPAGYSHNIGVRLGSGSGGIVDVDLDCREAVVLADLYLPSGAAIAGRESNPRSHWFYWVSSPIKTRRFKSDCGATLVELRSDGAQTLLPPSKHPSGEWYEWSSDLSFASVDGSELMIACSCLAAASLLAQSYPPLGSRHEYALHMAGLLAKAGLTSVQVIETVRRIAQQKGDEEVADRVRAAEETAAKVAAGETVSGLAGLAEHLTPKAIERVRKWLNCDDTQTLLTEPLQLGLPASAKPPLKGDIDLLYGPVGDLVRHVAEHTEADPVGIYFHLLAMLSAAVGHRYYLPISGPPTYLNLMVLIVGASAHGRKGTAKRVATGIIESVAPGWTTRHLITGLSSGEGLAAHLTGSRTDESHPTPLTKAVVVETEFASVLQSFRRDGNNLSATLRNASDGEVLQFMTRKSPIRAGAYHLALIGHITSDELKLLLTRAEKVNGLINRLLICHIHRSRMMPFGTERDIFKDLPSSSSINSLLTDEERVAQPIGFSESGRSAWRDAYEGLSQSQPGLIGPITDRGESHALKLAALLAITEGVVSIDDRHVHAAIALWRHCVQSTVHVFGNSTGNRLADQILQWVEEHGETLKMEELYSLTHRNRERSQLEEALKVLQTQGFIEVFKESGHRGRPRLVFKRKVTM